MSQLLPGNLILPTVFSEQLLNQSRAIRRRISAIADEEDNVLTERDLATNILSGRCLLNLRSINTNREPRFKPPPLNRFHERPPIEIASAPMLRAAEAGAFKPATLLAAASALTGGTVSGIRSMAVTNSADTYGKFYTYADQKTLVSEVMKMCDLVNNPFQEDSLIEALAVFSSSLVVHPFPDGNGRIARAMFHSVLAARGVAVVPIIPLGPALYVNAVLFLDHMHNLERSDDWEGFFKFMLRLIHRIIDHIVSVRSGGGGLSQSR